MRSTFFFWVFALLLQWFCYHTFRTHPIARPDYLEIAILLTRGILIVGGFWAGKALLYKSPLRKVLGPTNDWCKLWLWTGPAYGILLTLSILLASWISQDQLGGRLLPVLVLANIASGATVWLVGSIWAFKTIRQDIFAIKRDQYLALSGLALNLLAWSLLYGLWPKGWSGITTAASTAVEFSLTIGSLMPVALLTMLLLRFAPPKGHKIQLVKNEDLHEEDSTEDDA